MMFTQFWIGLQNTDCLASSVSRNFRDIETSYYCYCIMSLFETPNNTISSCNTSLYLSSNYNQLVMQPTLVTALILALEAQQFYCSIYNLPISGLATSPTLQMSIADQFIGTNLTFQILILPTNITSVFKHNDFKVCRITQ